jgi:hypothetical protein
LILIKPQPHWRGKDQVACNAGGCGCGGASWATKQSSLSKLSENGANCSADQASQGVNNKHHHQHNDNNNNNRNNNLLQLYLPQRVSTNNL